MSTSLQKGWGKALNTSKSKHLRSSSSPHQPLCLHKSPWETPAPNYRALCVSPAPLNLTSSFVAADEGAYCREGEMLCPETGISKDAHLNWYFSPSALHSLYFCLSCFPLKLKMSGLTAVNCLYAFIKRVQRRWASRVVFMGAVQGKKKGKIDEYRN